MTPPRPSPVCTQKYGRVYALGINKWVSPVQAGLGVAKAADGGLRVRLHLSTIPPWVRNAAPGTVVEKLKNFSWSPPTLGKRPRDE